MTVPIVKLNTAEFPPLLAEIPQPPTELYLQGNLPVPELKLIAVVGSRKYTSYGKQVVDTLICGLANYPIGIVSGLALGIDALAHEAALRAGLYTIAVPGSGLHESILYPASNRRLASRILESGGGLLSEYEPTTPAAPWTFPQRNRIMAGMSHATLMIEAAEKSGTLITARLASDYNRELLVVPGSIFSKNSAGTHQFLKLGATPITTAEDILLALGIEVAESAPQTKSAAHEDLAPAEQAVLNALLEPTDRDTLIRASGLSPSEANALLMQMEMKNLIISENNVYRSNL